MMKKSETNGLSSGIRPSSSFIVLSSVQENRNREQSQQQLEEKEALLARTESHPQHQKPVTDEESSYSTVGIHTNKLLMVLETIEAALLLCEEPGKQDVHEY